jgi:hypothetical protein
MLYAVQKSEISIVEYTKEEVVDRTGRNGIG